MKIYFDKLYRYDRLQEPAGIALPFKEGELKSADRIAITQNGKKCMVQPKVTSKHADGSIRYLYVMEAAKKREYLLLRLDRGCVLTQAVLHLQ